MKNSFKIYLNRKPHCFALDQLVVRQVLTPKLQKLNLSNCTRAGSGHKSKYSYQRYSKAMINELVLSISFRYYAVKKLLVVCSRVAPTEAISPASPMSILSRLWLAVPVASAATVAAIVAPLRTG